MNITFPNNTKSVIDNIRGVIGRNVEFLIESTTPCSGCSINPITNTSTNPFCVVCSGEGYITTVSGYVVSGHVTWGNMDRLGWETGGQLMLSLGRIQVEYTPDNVIVTQNSKEVIVDGRTLRIKNRIFRGAPSLNRILVDLDGDE